MVEICSRCQDAHTTTGLELNENRKMYVVSMHPDLPFHE